METKGINILEKVFNENNGKDAVVSISHILYGDQKLKCELDFIFDDRIGLRIKTGQEIFIYACDMVEFGINDGIYFADELMKISITL